MLQVVVRVRPPLPREYKVGAFVIAILGMHMHHNPLATCGSISGSKQSQLCQCTMMQCVYLDFIEPQFTMLAMIVHILISSSPNCFCFNWCSNLIAGGHIKTRPWSTSIERRSRCLTTYPPPSRAARPPQPTSRTAS